MNESNTSTADIRVAEYRRLLTDFPNSGQNVNGIMYLPPPIAKVVTLDFATFECPFGRDWMFGHMWLRDKWLRFPWGAHGFDRPPSFYDYCLWYRNFCKGGLGKKGSRKFSPKTVYVHDDIVKRITSDAQAMVGDLMIKDSFHNSQMFWDIYSRYYLLEVPVSIFSGVLSSARKRMFSRNPDGSIYACVPRGSSSVVYSTNH